MPTAPPTRCNTPTCPHLATQRGRCDTHYVPWEHPSANTRALSRAEATRFRSDILARDPICRACNDAPSTEADHIIPIGDGGSRLSRANGQGLCAPCHQAKTTAENRARTHARRQHR